MALRHFGTHLPETLSGFEIYFRHSLKVPSKCLKRAIALERFERFERFARTRL